MSSQTASAYKMLLKNDPICCFIFQTDQRLRYSAELKKHIARGCKVESSEPINREPSGCDYMSQDTNVWHSEAQRSSVYISTCLLTFRGSDSRRSSVQPH